jgi:hypothetical protein
MLWTERCSVQISAGTLAILNETIRDFPHALRANAGLVPRLCHDHFLPNPFQSVVYQLSFHTTPCSLDTDSVVNTSPPPK